ncbi:MAG: hypothetical protein HOH38_00880 [Nitrospinaceae bacterium]|jgi:hypothetical protein|nr:hypothetical protein [Nitrospinaceae bacterium]MBT6345348.1 hypothetical protein [Nitrospina sp.]
MIASKTRAIFICILLLAPATLWAGEDNTEQKTKHIYTVIEFESKFMNRRQEQVLAGLGEPDRKWEHRGKKVWTYNQVIKEQGKIWNQNIMFDFGRVNMMWGELPNEGEHKG